MTMRRKRNSDGGSGLGLIVGAAVTAVVGYFVVNYLNSQNAAAAASTTAAPTTAAAAAALPALATLPAGANPQDMPQVGTTFTGITGLQWIVTGARSGTISAQRQDGVRGTAKWDGVQWDATVQGGAGGNTDWEAAFQTAESQIGAVGQSSIPAPQQGSAFSMAPRSSGNLGPLRVGPARQPATMSGFFNRIWWDH
jgi:hypothetical protein